MNPTLASPRAARATKATKTPWGQLLTDQLAAYDDLYSMNPLARAQLVKLGAPAKSLAVISRDMDLPREKLQALIGVKRATASRKLASGVGLSPDESERVVGLAKLIGQVASIVRASGQPEGFQPARWFSDWMEQPAPALGGIRPAELLDTADGRDAVSRLLAQMQSGAYA